MAIGAAIGGLVISGASAINQANQADKALSSQERANSEARAAQQAGTEQARSDLGRLFTEAGAQGQQGFQGALDVFKDVVPQQSTIFQQGNLNAQNTLLSGLAQQQNAILGGNVDLSVLQPSQQINPDFSFLNQQQAPTTAGLNTNNGNGLFDFRTNNERQLQNFTDLSGGQRLDQVLGNFGGVGQGFLGQPLNFSGMGIDGVPNSGFDLTGSFNFGGR